MALTSASISGQGSKAAPDKPLSNDDVLAMLSAGVGESTVIAAIEHASKEDLDVQGTAVARLKKAGIGQAVIDAMVKRAAQRGKTTAASQTPNQASELTKQRVLLAGVGSAPFLQTVLDGIMDYLVGRRVPAKQLEGEPMSRGAYLERVSSAGGESPLYITLDLTPHAFKHSLRAQCFEPQGKLLWEEEVRISGLVGGSSDANSLLGKLKEALEPHFGKPGLPTADVATSK